MKKNIGIIIALIIVIVLLGVVVVSNIMHATKKVQNPIVTMEIADIGTVKIELYPDMAPNTVANFISLINEGYYNGLTLEKLEDTMVTSKDKEDVENNQAIEGEFLENGYEENTLRHDRGVISMSRSDYSNLGLAKEGYNSAFAEFVIMTENTAARNGYYAGFGKVIEGMEFIDKVLSEEKEDEETENEATQTEETSEEVDENLDETEAVETVEDTEEAAEGEKTITITKMTVDTFGVNYGTPKRVEAFDINSYLMKLYGLNIQ